MFQVIRSPKVYDVCIIGSGAAGGTARSTGVANGAPSFMEWYSAWGLLATVVWLYLEVLYLLVRLRR